ncbi:MAG: hypothetical protein ABR615_05690 [Pseudonocardiaceae bacterium]
MREAAPLEVRRAEQAARLTACQIIAVPHVLAHENQIRISAGKPADALAPDARAEADHAFDLLRGGLELYRT